MNSIIEIDISQDNNYVKTYGKVNGWVICKKLNLPTFSKIYLINDFIDDKDKELLDLFGVDPLLCRTDAPWGYGNKLPRGRNVTVFQINSFLREIKDAVANGVILICVDPYNLNMKGTIPRHKIDGGVFVLFENNRIVIEHVGKGFDVGDITRGKSVHNRIIIPNSMAYDDPNKIFRYLKINFPENFHSISLSNYKIEKTNRENELIHILNEQGFSNFSKTIPEYAQPFTLELFKRIYEECIERVLYSSVVLERPFGVMMNLYNNSFCVFEVWQKKRSL